MDQIEQNQNVENWFENLEIFQNKQHYQKFCETYKQFTEIQNCFLEQISNNKKRLFIETPLQLGKTSLFFFYLLQRLKTFDQKTSPLFIFFLPNPTFQQKLETLFQDFKDLFMDFPIDFIFLNNTEISQQSNCQGNTIRVIFGTINEVVKCFKTENLNPLDIECVMVDNLDFQISFGQFNNLKRFFQYFKDKSKQEFSEKQIIITVRYDLNDEIKDFRELIQEKFVNLRVLENYEEQLQETENFEIEKQESVFHQFFYVNQKKNCFSLLYLIIKFKIFPRNYLIITETIDDAYRVKLFMERGCLLKNVQIYNPKHPIKLKSYHVSIFNTKGSRMLCVPKTFIDDYKKNKQIKKLKFVKNIIFFNTSITHQKYQQTLDFLNDEKLYRNKKNIQDFNVIFMVESDTLKHLDNEEIDKKENLLYKILEDQTGKGNQFDPIPIKNSDIVLYNLRASEILKSLTLNSVKLHRLIEIKKIMLKSPQMKKYFENNEHERKLLIFKLNRLCKQYEKTKISIPSHIPSYLMPSIAEESSRSQKLQYLKKKHDMMKNFEQKLKNENPIFKDPSQLKSYSNTKIWQKKHKIFKKKINKKNIRKGIYNQF